MVLFDIETVKCQIEPSLHLVGLLDCHTTFTWPTARAQVFTAGEHALAGPTLALEPLATAVSRCRLHKL